MADAQPLVSIGVPVRNGGAALARALDTLVGQTYAKLEILISDNASTDETEQVCRDLARRDARVQYVRQPATVPVLDNYRMLFERARGDLFMWAAHDDLRSPNYVETLVAAFHDSPGAALIAGDVVEFDDPAGALAAPVIAHDFATGGLGTIARLRKHTTIGCNHVYGLLNPAYVRAYSWREDVSWDVPFLSYLAERGPFVYAPGAIFYYYRAETQNIEARARETSFGRVRRFQTARTAWLTARAISDGRRDRGRWCPAVWIFPAVLFFFFQGVRGLIAASLPGGVRSALRRSMGATRA